MNSCCTFTAFAIALFSAFIGFCYLKITKLIRPLPKPTMDPNRYWGRGDGKDYKPDTKVYEFKIHATTEQIQDLQQQLSRKIHLAEPLEGIGFEYGFNSNTLKKVVTYWREKYLSKWQERENYLNQFQQYKTEIQGLKIHFIHQKPKAADLDKKRVVPLLLLHGWPGSVREFYDFIPLLTNDENSTGTAFEVVAPSLVGYGFSDAAPKTGFNAAEMATVMRNLMLRLGHTRFLIQGGDWGAVIGSNIATLYPENVIAYHSNMCILNSPLAILKGIYANYFPDKYIPNRSFYNHHFPIWEKYRMLVRESGYFHLQATKPDTIGAALESNPIGLAAYILEKFQMVTGPSLANDLDALDKVYTLDAVLDNLMFYYLSNSATSAGRFYAENMSKPYRKLKLDRVPSPVPMGCARFMYDLPPVTDWQLRDKFPNLVHSQYFLKGGHFPAFELPSILYNDFMEFVKKVQLQ